VASLGLYTKSCAEAISPNEPPEPVEVQEIFVPIPVEPPLDLTAVYVVGGLLLVAIPIALVLFFKRKEIGLEKNTKEITEVRKREPSFVKNMHLADDEKPVDNRLELKGKNVVVKKQLLAELEQKKQDELEARFRAERQQLRIDEKLAI